MTKGSQTYGLMPIATVVEKDGDKGNQPLKPSRSQHDLYLHNRSSQPSYKFHHPSLGLGLYVSIKA